MGIRVRQSVRRVPFATTDVKHIDPGLQSVHDVWHEWDDAGPQGALQRLLLDTGPERHEVLELVVKDSAPAAKTVDNTGLHRREDGNHPRKGRHVARPRRLGQYGCMLRRQGIGVAL